MEKTTKDRISKTLLHDWHVTHGANMANFGGYEMPLWYPAGVKVEHRAVLTAAGLFDTSHMAVVTVRGSDAHDLLQYCFTKDLDACAGRGREPLTSGRCVYGAFLDENGYSIDDAIVYQFEQGSYMIVVNAGMGGRIARHLSEHRGSKEVEITDLSDRVGKLDVQGPKSAVILGRILASPEKVFEKLSYFSFKGHFDPASPGAGGARLKDGTPVLLSRTGYTGEFGFEIFIAPEHFVRLWETILEAGKDLALIPCGLGARDSLRSGAVLPLSHQDIGNWPFINHPWPFALPFDEDMKGFTKDFLGRGALLNGHSPEYTLAFVGNDLRKVCTEDPAVVLDVEGREIGRVLTCVSDMGIGRHEGRIYSIADPDKPENFDPAGLSCGFVKVRMQLKPGDTVELKDRRRKLKVTIVEDIRPNRTARRPIQQML